MERITIFTGHYGSGKTETAINYAIAMRQTFDRVYIVDLDIVNPYFRTIDAQEQLTALGIEVLASQFAGTNVDIPSLPPDILKVFSDPSAGVVFDVGGDEDGAIALGQYKRYFDEAGYAMYVVANCFRPMTRTAEDIAAMVQELQAASRLQATGLVNCSNLAGQTQAHHVLEGQSLVEQAAQLTGIPVAFTCALPNIAAQLPPELSIFPIRRHLTLLFEE